MATRLEKILKSDIPTLASAAQLVGESSHKPKVCSLDSQSGHMPRLRVRSQCRHVRSLVWAHMGGNQSMLLSHIDVFLSLPLSLLSLYKNNEKMSSSEDKKKEKKEIQHPRQKGPGSPLSSVTALPWFSLYFSILHKVHP